MITPISCYCGNSSEHCWYPRCGTGESRANVGDCTSAAIGRVRVDPASRLAAGRTADSTSEAGVTAGRDRQPNSRSVLCPHCGSVLSVVTWTCVRGEYCPGAKNPQTPADERAAPKALRGRADAHGAPIQLRNPAAGTIRTAQGKARWAVPATGQPPVGTAPILSPEVSAHDLDLAQHPLRLTSVLQKRDLPAQARPSQRGCSPDLIHSSGGGPGIHQFSSGLFRRVAGIQSTTSVDQSSEIEPDERFQNTHRRNDQKGGPVPETGRCHEVRAGSFERCECDVLAEEQRIQVISKVPLPQVGEAVGKAEPA